MEPDVLEALRPTLKGFHLVVQAKQDEDRPLYRRVPVVVESLSKARAKVTNSCNYSTDRTTYHTVIYEWDVDSEAWSLVEYIPQDTHKNEFPWRAKKSKS